MSDDVAEELLRNTLRDAYGKGYAKGWGDATARFNEMLTHLASQLHVGVPNPVFLDNPIEFLELSERPYNCLRRARIWTLRELVSKTEDDLLAITNFGQKSVDEVVDKLAMHGLKLADR